MTANLKISPFGHTRNQYLAVFVVNVLIIGLGCGIGWFSPALPLLLSSDTPLTSGPLTTEQLSWAGSIAGIGSIIGSLIFGYLMVRIGTKRSLLLLTIPQTVSWVLLVIGSASEYICAARFLGGVSGGGGQICSALYFAEIANDNIRGKLSTTYILSRSIGTLLAYVLGIYMNYIQASIVYIAISLAFAISFIFVPATPQHLLRIGANDEAREAFKFYKGCKSVDRSAYRDPDFENAFQRLQTISKESKADSDLSWKDLMEPESRKGITIGIVLSFLSQSCGSYIFIVYASTIFARSGTNFSPEWSSVVLALVQIVGTLLAARFVETQGRKPLLIISLVGCTFGNSAMAAYLYCDKLGYDVSMFTWVPVTSLGFVILISSVGIVPLPRLCLVEALPSKVRSFGLTVGMISLSAFLFITLALYPILLEIIDLHGCMLIFAATCVFGVFFVIFYVDETKGKTIDLLNAEKVTTKRETA